MGHKKHAPEEGGSEGWLVSYCDMISLLVTFFLMMMTFSTPVSGDVKSVSVGLLKGRGGAFDHLKGNTPEEVIDPTVLENLSRDLDRLRTAAGADNRIALAPMLDGLAIQFDSDCSFDTGSALVNPKLRANLELTAVNLAQYDQLIVVEGHTDADDEAGARHPTAEALSTARALAAARILLEQGAIDGNRIQIAGLCFTKPRVGGTTALERRLNRRIELKVLAISRTKALGTN